MKYSILISAITYFFILSTHTSKAQETKTITLNVNTSEITRSTVNENANFGQSPRISNEDFTIEVSLDDVVVWKGLSTSSEDDRVEILSINHEGGVSLFNYSRNILKGENGVVSAVVTKGKAGDSDKYTIKFRVYRNGERLPGTFQIDPKIVIKR